jgi:hypothetical protein
VEKNCIRVTMLNGLVHNLMPYFILKILFYFDLRPDTCILRLIRARRMRWPGHVAHTGDTRNVYKI